MRFNITKVQNGFTLEIYNLYTGPMPVNTLNSSWVYVFTTLDALFAFVKEQTDKQAP